jgi:putative hydrolase of the HAD superfamily
VVVRAVTLDAAGTLFDVAEPVGATYARIAAAHGIALDAGAVERGFRVAFAGAPPLAFPGASPVRLADHERAWWYTVVRAAFGRAGGSPAFDPCFAELYTHYARPDAWRVHADVPDALRALRTRGLRLGVVSNFDGRLPGLMAGLGLAPLVDAVTHSSLAGAAKPDPAIFHAALTRLGVAPPEALHVGDDPRADVEGARAAGMHALLVDRTGCRADGEGVRDLGAVATRLRA